MTLGKNIARDIDTGNYPFARVSAETVVYPRCQLADPMGPGGHDFTDARNGEGLPVIYCTVCGLVQPLETLP